MRTHTLTPEQQRATQERKTRFRELVKHVGAMSDADRETLARRMTGLVTCEGHVLSLTNTLLIAMQSNGFSPPSWEDSGNGSLTDDPSRKASMG